MVRIEDENLAHRGGAVVGNGLPKRALRVALEDEELKEVDKVILLDGRERGQRPAEKQSKRRRSSDTLDQNQSRNEIARCSSIFARAEHLHRDNSVVPLPALRSTFDRTSRSGLRARSLRHRHSDDLAEAILETAADARTRGARRREERARAWLNFAELFPQVVVQEAQSLFSIVELSRSIERLGICFPSLLL